MARRPNDIIAEKFEQTYDHGSLAASVTVKQYKVPVGRTLRIDRLSYVNPTGLVGDPTNTFSLEVKKNATSISLVFNTDTNDAIAGVTLPVDTFVEGTLTATDADRVLVAGDILNLVFTKEGTATLPAGHLVIEGRLF